MFTWTRYEIVFRNVLALEVALPLLCSVFGLMMQSLRNAISRTSTFPSTTWEREAGENGRCLALGFDTAAPLSIFSSAKTGRQLKAFRFIRPSIMIPFNCMVL